MKKIAWKKYGLEFLSIFIAVISAFALNNWGENRRDSKAELKILSEISNGLEKDIDDVQLNVTGHNQGLAACAFWRKVILGQTVGIDSLTQYYFDLTRDYVSIQNTSGYETLKSKGLELISNDSLRLKIISLYEYDYNTLKKLEEEYQESQFHANYFEEINRYLAPNFEFDENGDIVGMKMPLSIPAGEKNILLSYLWKIQANRFFILKYYSVVEKKIIQLREEIEQELNR